MAAGGNDGWNLRRGSPAYFSSVHKSGRCKGLCEAACFSKDPYIKRTAVHAAGIHGYIKAQAYKDYNRRQPGLSDSQYHIFIGQSVFYEI